MKKLLPLAVLAALSSVHVASAQAAFSGTRVGDQNLGSSLNFEDRIGAGLKFANGQSVGVRAIHYSNAGLKQPNDGIESYSLFYKIPI
ncbi:acyloxyacyl hydrolase [Pseudomonas aeruginosa]|nr:acyloxyacyl hydrolase [Pseudomonas aeruginosa]MEB5179147.1 acyloxyacyl hydrolase [Pseudomonas aeruginosa]